MKERRKSWEPWVISLVRGASLYLKTRWGTKQHWHLIPQVNSRLVDMPLCLPEHQEKRTWEIRQGGAAWDLQGGGTNPFCSLAGQIHLDQIDPVKGSLDWIFFQVPPEREGKSLSEETAVARGCRIDLPEQKLRWVLIDVESSPAALLRKVRNPRGCSAELQLCFAFLSLSRIFFPPLISSFNVTAFE